MKKNNSCSCHKQVCTCDINSCSCSEEGNCSSEESIVTISAKALKDKLDQAEDFVLINVLEPEVFKDCHIPGSINIPFAVLQESLQNWDRNKNIVVHCAQVTCPLGKRSYLLLKKMGFKRLAEFEGGMREWKLKGMKCIGRCEWDYLR